MIKLRPLEKALKKGPVMELIGKTTINPILFYSGKVAGYITWIVYLLFVSGVNLFELTVLIYRAYAAYFLGLIGLIFIVLSMISLGKSTRLGLPSDHTILKTRGLYKISRNPIYVGFNLLTISSMIYTFNIWIIILGVYSILIYHLIILGEERFLENRFEAEFLEYKKKTRRYL